MRKILVGLLDHPLGAVELARNGEWFLEPLPGVATEELQATLDSVFARVRRRERTLTRAQFVQKFFGKFAPVAASTTSAWAKRVTSAAHQKDVEKLFPADDPIMAEIYRQYVGQKPVVKQA